jgi:sarcosine oxidase
VEIMSLSVTVIGAGAFGGWTALHLLRAGARVTLVDAWGAGNSRASSGDETRIIRASYGPHAIYTEMVGRALPLWKENERRWKTRLVHQTSSLWMAPADDSWETCSLENIRSAGMKHEVVGALEGCRRWPQMNWEGITWAVHELEAGYLLAQRSCQAVLDGFCAENGVYVQARVQPNELGAFPADVYVFACGPWLGELFPDILGNLIVPTRQEIFCFRPADGDTRFNDKRFPAWVDNSPVRFYGIPANQSRGFKVARDVPGPRFDPTRGERTVTADGLSAIRNFLACRFPALKDAPVMESRVCPYEMSPDGGLIVDRHPLRSDIWFAGGGSGHGFKLGPAVGEHVAQLLLGKSKVRAEFGLARFATIDKGQMGPRI